MTDAAPGDVTLEESGRSERGISAEDSMAAMKSQLKLMKSLHQASTFDLGSVRRRQPHATPHAPLPPVRPPPRPVGPARRLLLPDAEERPWLTPR